MEPRLRLGLLLFGLGIALALALRILFPFVGPFLLGFVLAVFIEPAVDWSERRFHLPRGLAVALILGLGITVFGFGLGLMVLQILSGLRAFAAGKLGRDLLLRWAAWLEAGAGWLRGLPSPVRQAAALFVRLLPDRLAAFLQALLGWLGRVPEWIGFIFLGLIIAYFLTRDRELVGRFLLALLPPAWREKAAGIKGEMARAFAGLLQVEFLLFFLTFLLSTAWLGILGFPAPWFLGALMGYLDLLPLVGPGTLLLPWAGFRLAVGDWGKGMGLVGLFLLLVLLRETIEARLLGRRLRLHPLAVLAALYLGLRVFGPGGVFFGPALLLFLRALYGVLLFSGAPKEGLAKR
ncbi:MAG: AI-2E family transporter [Bacillota bacterium]